MSSRSKKIDSSDSDNDTKKSSSRPSKKVVTSKKDDSDSDAEPRRSSTRSGTARGSTSSGTKKSGTSTGKSTGRSGTSTGRSGTNSGRSGTSRGSAAASSGVARARDESDSDDDDAESNNGRARRERIGPEKAATTQLKDLRTGEIMRYIRHRASQGKRTQESAFWMSVADVALRRLQLRPRNLTPLQDPLQIQQMGPMMAMPQMMPQYGYQHHGPPRGYNPHYGGGGGGGNRYHGGGGGGGYGGNNQGYRPRGQRFDARDSAPTSRDYDNDMRGVPSGEMRN
jgi:hypothetical protein